MIVAIHQPLFAPWAGYFHKMLLADVFVVLDHVAYTHNNRINRNQIRLADGRRDWLTVPVVKSGRGMQPICEVEIATAKNPRWRRKHLVGLEQHYRSAGHYGWFAPAVHEVYAADCERIAELDLLLIDRIRSALDIDTPLVRSSSLRPTGTRSHMLARICREVGGDVYLAGMGGSRDYLDPSEFDAAGVRVVYQDFRHPTYPQGELAFESGLSMLDVLFHCGPGAAPLLRECGGAGQLPGEEDRKVNHA